jgi:hypothetical protein
MKKPIFLLAFPLLAGMIFFFSSYGVDECDYPSGAPAGYTDSPGDGKNCTQCHGGSASPVTGWITSDIPAAGYTTGTTYNITVTVSGSGHKGFEVSPQNVTGDQLGTLIAGTGSHLTGGNKYVTHNSDPTSNPATWTFQWTAPSAGTGEVTFYGAFAVSKNTTKTSTLLVSENTAVPLTVIATATPSTILIGDSSHLDATPAGGSGTYTYSWESIPAGFSSQLKNPWVKPLESTAYVVIVSDGSGTALDTAYVTVSNVGIADRQGKSDIRLTPNPTGGAFSVIVGSGHNDLLTARVFTMNGLKIWESSLPGAASGQVFDADIRNRPDGIYLVSVTDGAATTTLKLVKSTK